MVWHDLPFPPGKTRRRRRRTCNQVCTRNLVAAAPRRTSTARDDSFEDVDVDLEYETPFLEQLRPRAPGGAARRGRDLRRARRARRRPGAARAAGTFCARNRLGLFVPCHRVVAAGGLGSYGSFGLAYKRRLLELEGVAL